MNDKLIDWRDCRYFWQDMMYYEAARAGAEARAAGRTYADACQAYEAKHCERFDPHERPQDSPRSEPDLLELAEDDSILGLARSLKQLAGLL